VRKDHDVRHAPGPKNTLSYVGGASAWDSHGDEAHFAAYPPWVSRRPEPVWCVRDDGVCGKTPRKLSRVASIKPAVFDIASSV
jgi:hypothetical protein